MDLRSMLLHAWQRNFAGHPDKCPAEALPRNKALGGISGTLGSFRRCYGNTSEESSAFRAAPPNGERPSPHQETEVYLSSEYRTPALLYLRRTSLREILPPDALRHIGAMTESSRRQTAEGGEVILCPAVSANPLRLSNERPSEACSRSLLKLVVMNCIFNVNRFFPDSRKKIFSSAIYRFSSKRQSHITVQARVATECPFKAFATRLRHAFDSTFLPDRRVHA